MTTKPNRHAMVEVICKWCGEKFMARKQRVDKGQSQFCTMGHYREYQKSIGSQRKNIGKENAIIQWDKPKKMYVAYWYDDQMKYHSTPWARWYWELNVGEIPAGFYASYRDGNSRNNIPENVCLKTMAEITNIGARSQGIPKSKETRSKLSVAHSGKVLSEEHKVNIGNAQRKMWADGKFDDVHKGEHNRHWRGGILKPYPKAFYEIKGFVKERDKYTCQICGKSVYRSRHGHVHHIDGNKDNNEPENLILLCSTCHSKVHMTIGMSSPVIMAFRSKLEWNRTEETE